LSHAAQPIPARRQASTGIGRSIHARNPYSFHNRTSMIIIYFANHVLHFHLLPFSSSRRGLKLPKTWDSLVLSRVASARSMSRHHTHVSAAFVQLNRSYQGSEDHTGRFHFSRIAQLIRHELFLQQYPAPNAINAPHQCLASPTLLRGESAKII
jgi:hypothetical protein